MDFLFNKYNVERKDDIKSLLMKSFSETLRLDAESPKLKDFSQVLNLKNYLRSLIRSFDQIIKIFFLFSRL